MSGKIDPYLEEDEECSSDFLDEYLPASRLGIDKIAAALSKAQGEMHSAAKDSKNDFLGNSFASLGSVINVIREPFANNELSFTQMPSTEGGLVLTTTLMHSSGQSISSTMKLPYTPGKSELQSIGSAITYGKRYMLMAMVGIPSEDDDGNGASDDLSHTFKKLCEELELTEDQISTALAERDVGNFGECSVEQAKQIIAKLRAMKARKSGPGRGAQVK